MLGGYKSCECELNYVECLEVFGYFDIYLSTRDKDWDLAPP